SIQDVLLPVFSVLAVSDHIQRQVHSVCRVHNIHIRTGLIFFLMHHSDLALVVYPLLQVPPYSFVIVATLANTCLIPVGAGNAISSSIASPSPCTFTTVPAPHFLCAALSPGPHVSLSAPVVVCIFCAFRFNGDGDGDGDGFALGRESEPNIFA